jgi:hypothetical protein
MIDKLLSMVVEIVALHPYLGIAVGLLSNGAKGLVFGQLFSLKRQHSSGNLASTFDPVGD